MDTIKKINEKYYVNLQREEIQYILDFTLLWNLFELNFFEKFFKESKIDYFVKLKLTIEEDSIFKYFQKRYISNGKSNYEFEYLNIKKNKKKTIENNLKKGNNKLYTVIFIISRFRNNLFHGEKSIKLIDGQKENFKVTNIFLLSLLK